MYERFTDRARKVMQLANQEAQQFNHKYVDTGHILIGLTKEGSGVAAAVLKNLNVGLRDIRQEVERIALRSRIMPRSQRGDEGVTGRLPHSPRAEKAIEYSIEEAEGLSHKYVGTEHLLLGLLREQEGVAARVLYRLGLTSEYVRKSVVDLIEQSRPRPCSKPFPEIAATVAANGSVSNLTDAALDVIDFYQNAARYGGRWDDLAAKMVAIARQHLIDHPPRRTEQPARRDDRRLGDGKSVFVDASELPPPDADEMKLEEIGWKRTGLFIGGYRVYESAGTAAHKTTDGTWSVKFLTGLGARSLCVPSVVEVDQLARLYALLFLPPLDAFAFGRPTVQSTPESDTPTEVSGLIPDRPDYHPE